MYVVVEPLIGLGRLLGRGCGCLAAVVLVAVAAGALGTAALVGGNHRDGGPSDAQPGSPAVLCGDVACPRGLVSRADLHAGGGAASSYVEGSVVFVECTADGPVVADDVEGEGSSQWHRLDTGDWVPALYVTPDEPSAIADCDD